MYILGLILSATIGLSLGLIGGGGSIITVPVLVYVMGVEPHEAVGMSLAVVGATSLVGAFMHFRRGNVQPKAGMTFGAAGVLGAFAGSPLTRLLSSQALLLSFAVLMLVIAIVMLRRQHKPLTDFQHEKSASDFWKALAAGFGVGVLTGFLGVGGGFLILPALVIFGGLSMKDAIGTSLFVIFINCIAGLVAHASQTRFSWTTTGAVTVLAVSGAIAGTALSHQFAAHKLQRAFAYFVLAVAVFLFAKNYGVLFS